MKNPNEKINPDFTRKRTITYENTEGVRLEHVLKPEDELFDATDSRGRWFKKSYSEEHPDGYVFKKIYDESGKQVAFEDSHNYRWVKTYHSNGVMSTHVETKNGFKTISIYNVFGKLLQRQMFDANGDLIKEVIQVYDETGKLLSRKNINIEEGK